MNWVLDKPSVVASASLVPSSSAAKCNVIMQTFVVLTRMPKCNTPAKYNSDIDAAENQPARNIISIY